MLIAIIFYTVFHLSITPSVALDEQTLLMPFPAEVALNETIVFKPVTQHHFNLKSKNSCGSGRLLKVEESAVECQITKAGETAIELFICDDKQSYCRREQITVITPRPKGFKEWLRHLWNS
ncbi:MAG: hypothetical protein K2Q26_01980 [Bdellovibrionales bacterium]|nr:hypothetical protein [Bdellovibrionales bacterium]